MPCIFCNIVNGEIPSFKIFEDEDVLAFLDVNPVTRGHCLVIPKMHFESIFDIPEELLQKVIVSGKNISKKIKDVLQPDGIRLSQSNGEVAGQAIFHFHLHVIPRYKNDGLSMDHHTTASPSKADMEELKKIALQLCSGQAEKLK